MKVGRYLKEILILNSFCFEEKDPRFTRLKAGLALRLFSKGLFYIRAMVFTKCKELVFIWVFQRRAIPKYFL